MIPVLNIGPLAVQSFGLILLLGVWLGLSWSEKKAERHQLNPDLVFSIFFLALISGVIGARFGYVLRYLNSFNGHPLDFLSLNFFMMDWPSGVLVAVLAVLIYCQRKKISVMAVLDSYVPLFLLFNLSYALASLANYSAIGSATTLPWGVQLYGSLRHPVQIYHTLAAILLLGVFWPGRETMAGIMRTRFPAGGQFLCFLLGFIPLMLVVQTFRANYPTLFLGINSYHLVGILIFVIALTQCTRMLRQMESKP